jgi:hypothetical protein
LDDSQNIVFAVGTGTGTSNRRTGMWIDSGSNAVISGSLGVSGSQNVSGAVTASSFTGSFVGDGSGLTGLPAGNRNGLITTGSFGSTQTIAGVLQISSSADNTNQIPLQLLYGPNTARIDILGGGPAFYRNSSDYNTVLGNASGVGNGFATGSEKNMLFTGFFLGFSSGSQNTVISGNGAANFRSGSQNTILGQVGNLEFGNANTYIGAGTNNTLEDNTLRIGAGNNEILTKSGSLPLQINSTVQVTGSLQVSSNATITGSLQVGNTSNFTGSMVQSGSVKVIGSTTVTGSLQTQQIDVDALATTTASLDLSLGNTFYVTSDNNPNGLHLQLSNGTNGQQVVIWMTTNQVDEALTYSNLVIVDRDSAALSNNAKGNLLQGSVINGTLYCSFTRST